MQKPTPDELINLFEPSKYELLNYITITSSMALSGMFLTQPTVPAIFTPLASQLSSFSGFDLNEIFMMEVAAFSTIILPFQAPPIIIGLALANIKQTKILKILLILTIISILFLYPLQYYWMKFI